MVFWDVFHVRRERQLPPSHGVSPRTHNVRQAHVGCPMSLRTLQGPSLMGYPLCPLDRCAV
eukprot:354692-Chlamydomonas_euryale.AAC.2